MSVSGGLPQFAPGDMVFAMPSPTSPTLWSNTESAEIAIERLVENCPMLVLSVVDKGGSYVFVLVKSVIGYVSVTRIFRAF